MRMFSEDGFGEDIVLEEPLNNLDIFGGKLAFD